MPTGHYIAIDWGTSNRRIYLMRGDGTVIDTRRDGLGVLALASDAFAAEFDAIRSLFGDLPIIAAGMIGSNRGVAEVPYCAAPVDLGKLAANAATPLDGVHIVPGVSISGNGACDVMRGEEVQVLGAMLAGIAADTTTFCQPGTHNKWIEVEDGQIVSFATAMTGEIFSLLKSQSILGGMLDSDVSDSPAFRSGLERGAGCCDLPTALFQARAAVLLGERTREDTASYVSGLLIGADVGARKDLAGREVVLLSSGGLADLYGSAIRWAGATVQTIDSHAAFAAGIHAIKLELL